MEDNTRRTKDTHQTGHTEITEEEKNRKHGNTEEKNRKHWKTLKTQMKLQVWVNVRLRYITLHMSCEIEKIPHTGDKESLDRCR